VNLVPLIADLLDRSSDFLPENTNRDTARTLLLDELSLEYPDLSPLQRGQIAHSVLAHLTADDRFGWEFCGDISADENELQDAE
jgi:hypothetical protein